MAHQAGCRPRPARACYSAGHEARSHVCKLNLAWCNANARHPDVLAAQRRERARIRSERQQRWGRPKIKAA